ncbi:MAG: DNA recombination protein RmuC [Verrucomicrobia bacterium]|nr:DNA recombination protein RmuC [Verrucomicrobiota bacterium]
MSGILLPGLIGLLVGVVGAYAYFSGRVGKFSGEIEAAKRRAEEQEQARERAEAQSREAREGAVRAEAERQAAERSLIEARKEKEELAVRLQTEFRAVAQQMVTEGTKRLAEDNRTQVGIELRPILDRMEAFRKRVDEVHTAETTLQGDLRRELQQIQAMSTKLGSETHALTSALKSDSGVRGRWGELVLEKTLEISGLEKGREYQTQESADRKRMDAVVFLPGDRAIVIDSKVPLIDYDAYCSAAEPAEQEKCLKAHGAAVKRFIDDLSGKSYPDLLQGKSLDFTVMFIPVEPAFGAALRADQNLLQYAFDQRIVLTTPSSLMATLRTISNLWKIERQNRNVQEIARLGGKLHDDLANFCGDLAEVGKALGKAHEAHESAVKKLSEKKGNILGTAEKLRELGAKTEKKLPTMLGDGSE